MPAAAYPRAGKMTEQPSCANASSLRGLCIAKVFYDHLQICYGDPREELE
jgi:hypothetical protein